MKKISIILVISVITFFSCHKSTTEIDSNKLNAKEELSANLRDRPQIVQPTGGTAAMLPPTGPDPEIPTDCVKSTVNNKLISINAENSTDFIEGGNINYYNFKDNFLAQTTKGLTYINHYYKLGKFIREQNILTSSFTDIFETLRNGVTVCSRISSSSGGDIIIVDDAIYNHLKLMSNKIHEHQEYNQVKSIIEILDSDLEILRGKTKNQFISFFNGGL